MTCRVYQAARLWEEAILQREAAGYAFFGPLHSRSATLEQYF